MNKNDLRYKKTEDSLRTALVALLAARDRKNISVKDICGKAGCSRNAFYLHYKRKEDLYEAIINAILSRLISALQSDANVFAPKDEHAVRQYYGRVMEAIVSNREELDALIKQDRGPLMMKLTKAVFAGSLESMKAFSSGDPPGERSLNAAFLSAGIVGFIYEWFTNPKITDVMAEDFLFKTHQENLNIYKRAL